MGNSWGKAQVDPCFGDFGGKADEAGCLCFSAKIVSSQHCSLESAQAMASTFVSANRAKGSLGEAIIYKVFYPSVEGAVARRLLQLFYFALAAPWFIAWWGLLRYAKMAYFFVSGNTFELDYKSILAPLSLKGVDLSIFSADFNSFLGVFPNDPNASPKAALISWKP